MGTTRKATMNKAKVLTTSYLESDLVEHIRRDVLEVVVIYRPDLLGKPTYIADYSTAPTRSRRGIRCGRCQMS